MSNKIHSCNCLRYKNIIVEHLHSLDFELSMGQNENLIWNETYIDVKLFFGVQKATDIKFHCIFDEFVFPLTLDPVFTFAVEIFIQIIDVSQIHPKLFFSAVVKKEL